MRIPDALASLSDYGIIDEVLRPLMSGKEAQVYLVRSGGDYRVAKIYKDAQNRTFKNRADYTEGRKVRNSRDQRAMGKGSRHGRAQVEAAWRTTEVDMIYRLRDAGVRVPTPYHFIDGVLVMEMITDERGDPAPRLGETTLELTEAQAVFDRLLAEVVRMLAAGVVHGDLSDFNVLMSFDGPVIIDFPQAVDAASNQNARKLLLRDVDNLHRFIARFAPERQALPYAQEMWGLYERGELTPDTKLTGRYRPAERKVSTADVLGLIGDAARDERRRRENLGLSLRGTSDGMLRERESLVLESPPRPPSRYAQKREAQIAARRAEAAKAAPAARQVPRQDPPRAYGGSSSHGKSSNVVPEQRDSGRRTAPADARGSAAPGTRVPRHPAQPEAPHSEAQRGSAGATGSHAAADKRRRRRRKRKVSAEAPPPHSR